MAIAIGGYAGYTGQGTSAIAIGYNTGYESQHANSIILNATGASLNSTAASALYIAPIRTAAAGTSSHLRYDPATAEITYDTRTIAYNPAVAQLDMSGEGITALSDIYFANGAALTGTTGSGTTIQVIGDLLPATTDIYSLGSSEQRWADIWLTGQSAYIGDVAIGATLNAGITPQLTLAGDLIPSASLTYSLGSTSSRWAEAYIGPGTLDIAGPVGSTATATIGTDAAGIIYTKSGFASPTVIVGPAPGATTGAVGGWFIGVTGAEGTSGYDLYAQENLSTVGAGVTGPAYSLVKGVVRSITAGAGITTHSSTAGTTVALLATGVTGGTYDYPTSVAVNNYGQITSITGGPGITSYMPVSAFETITTQVLGPTIELAGVTLQITVPNSVINSHANIDVENTSTSNDRTISCWIDISGAGFTYVSDVTKTSKITKSTARTVICMDRVAITSVGTYSIKLWGSDSGGISLQHGHLMVMGNMY